MTKFKIIQKNILFGTWKSGKIIVLVDFIIQKFA